MRLIYKISVEFPAISSCVSSVRRDFFFEDTKEAEYFAKHTMRRNDDAKVVGTSIEHIMTAEEATDEIDEEMEMALRVAWSEIK